MHARKKVLLIASAMAAAVLAMILLAIAWNAPSAAIAEAEPVASDRTSEDVPATTSEPSGEDPGDGTAGASEDGAAVPTAASDVSHIDQGTEEPVGNRAAEAATAPVHSAASAAAPVRSPQQSQHIHDWQAETEQREIVDSAAWSEPVYQTMESIICSICNEDVTNGDKEGRSILEHGKAHALAGQGGGTHSAVKQVQVDTIEHPKTSHYETVTTGWRCSGCSSWKAA